MGLIKLPLQPFSHSQPSFFPGINCSTKLSYTTYHPESLRMAAENPENIGISTVEEVITSLNKFSRSKCEPADPDDPSFSRFTPLIRLEELK
jgi:hypothetical protein